MRTRDARHSCVASTRQVVAAWISACVIGACGGDAGGDASRLVELGRIQLFDANDALNGVRSLAVDATNGDVWALGATEPFVHRYDAAGNSVTSFGRAGDGPGELRVSQEILPPTPADPHVIVWSAGAGRLTRFARDGSLRETVGPVRVTRSVPTVVERFTYARAIPMARWGRGFLLQDQPRRDENRLATVMSLSNAALIVLDSAGVQRDTLLGFRTLIGPNRPPATVNDLAPLPVWAVCPAGEAVVVDPYAMRTRWFGQDGAATRSDTLPVPGEPITDADIERWLRNSMTIPELSGGRVIPETAIQDILREYTGARRGELGTASSPAVRVLCDADNDLWLQRYNSADEPRGLGREWVVVSEGRVLRRYRFPERFQPMALHAGTAYGVQKDSLDIERIAAVRYAKP